MRLGVVGMLPGDFRIFTTEQMASIRALQFTGFGFHFFGDDVFEITNEVCNQFNAFIAAENLDLVQLGIAYNECLFDTKKGVRERVTAKINRGLEISRQIEALVCLIRPGSLNPAGPWTPHWDNYLPENIERLIETLKPITQKAELEGVTIVIETHAISILDTPETCREVVEAVGSKYLRLVMDAVNHFQSHRQVYNSPDRLNHIFDVMGPIAPVAHIKDIKAQNRLVVHIDEEIPGEGELDIGLMLRRFDALYPDGYGLIEHLPVSKIPLAAQNVRRIAAQNGVGIHRRKTCS
jgi:sugar phosphate isomerase/epimerase